jgi:hypothetical protein
MFTFDPDAAAEHLQEKGGFSEKEASAITDLLTSLLDGDEEEQESDELPEGLSFVDTEDEGTAKKPTHLLTYTLFGREETFQSPPHYSEKKVSGFEVELRKSVNQRLKYILEYMRRRDGPNLSKSEFVERSLDLFLRSIEIYGDEAFPMSWLERGLAEEKRDLADPDQDSEHADAMTLDYGSIITDEQ